MHHMKDVNNQVLVKNSKAFFNYFLSDFLEAGIELFGTEIKSIRQNGASLSDAYIMVRDGEMYVLNMNIAPYEKGNIFNHEPLRTRRLLLHKKEIAKLESKVKEKGFALIPTKLYLHHGMAKLEVALGKGKNNYDKREVAKERDIKRSIDKALKSPKGSD